MACLPGGLAGLRVRGLEEWAARLIERNGVGLWAMRSPGWRGSPSGMARFAEVGAACRVGGEACRLSPGHESAETAGPRAASTAPVVAHGMTSGGAVPGWVAWLVVRNGAGCRVACFPRRGGLSMTDTRLTRPDLERVREGLRVARSTGGAESSGMARYAESAANRVRGVVRGLFPSWRQRRGGAPTAVGVAGCGRRVRQPPGPVSPPSRRP
jgi:hypothetical protein